MTMIGVKIFHSKLNMSSGEKICNGDFIRTKSLFCTPSERYSFLCKLIKAYLIEIFSSGSFLPYAASLGSLFSIEIISKLADLLYI